MPGWPPVGPPAVPIAAEAVIGILPGEGIGPEIMEAAIAVLRRAAARTGLALTIRQGGPIGTAAARALGRALTPDVMDFCDSVFAAGGAVLCGPGGGRFVYDLRHRFDLYCKLVPIRPIRALDDAGVLRPAARDGVDLLIVRENTGGCYFGQSSRFTHPDGTDEARHVFHYRAPEVRRIVEAAACLARARRRRLALVAKPGGIPAISELWTEVFDRIVKDEGLDGAVLEADNAAYQIVAAAAEFDVVVAPNDLGDILGDVAALLLGSRGVSYSANLGTEGRAVYQTAHGAAWDLAGRGTANPIGMLLAAAMMLRESFAALDAAAAIEAAIHRTLGAGIRTVDVAGSCATVVGTVEMGRWIARAVDELPTAAAPSHAAGVPAGGARVPG
jgi:3-isopropylmalate dehydrogenase